MNRATTLALDLAAVTILAVALSWLGPIAIDASHTAPTYASYGYTPDAAADAVDRSRAADQRACETLHGPHAVAVQLPDGQHRCTDKHGRRLSARSAVTVISKAQP